MALSPRIDSQDAWAFRIPARACSQSGETQAVEKPNLLCCTGLSVPLGLPNTDSRLAAVLRACGFRVINPVLDIVTAHVQSEERLQSPAGDSPAVQGDGEFVYFDM